MAAYALVVLVEDSPLSLARILQSLTRSVARIRSVTAVPRPESDLLRVCVVVEQGRPGPVAGERLRRLVGVRAVHELPLRRAINDQIRLVSALAREQLPVGEPRAHELEAALGAIEGDVFLGACGPDLASAAGVKPAVGRSASQAVGVPA